MCCPQWVEQAAGFHSHRACERRAAIKATDVHVEGNVLHQVKEELRSILRVSETIAIHGCVACSQSAACCKRWYSEAGAKEYAMTGCCELCLDDSNLLDRRRHLRHALMDPHPEGAEVLRHAPVSCPVLASFRFRLTSLAAYLEVARRSLTRSTHIWWYGN